MSKIDKIMSLMITDIQTLPLHKMVAEVVSNVIKRCCVNVHMISHIS